MSDWPETSETLIRRIREPLDATAWDCLVSLYRPVVYRMARRKGLAHESAEDVVQTVFLNVSRAIPKWNAQEGSPRFRNWLGRISRNAIVNAIVRDAPDRATGSTSVAEMLLAVPGEKDLSEALSREVRLEAIRQAAELVRSEFTGRSWEMFLATAMQGRPAANVANDFGCSVGAVYAARCRVTSRIREKIQEMNLTDLWSDSK